MTYCSLKIYVKMSELFNAIIIFPNFNQNNYYNVDSVSKIIK